VAAVTASGVHGVAQGERAGAGGLFGGAGEQSLQVPWVSVVDGFGDGGRQ
jgi:hypothetical protein